MIASLLPSASPDIAAVDVAFIGLVGTLVGYLIRVFLDKQKTFSSANGSIKRKMYMKYIEELVALGSQNLQSLSPEQVAKVYKEFGNHAKAFYATSILFASPSVVRAHASFVRHTDKPTSGQNNYELMLKLSHLYKAMRKDIGLSNRFLGIDGELLLRANVSDYDTTISKYVFFPKRFIRWLKARW